MRARGVARKVLMFLACSTAFAATQAQTIAHLEKQYRFLPADQELPRRLQVRWSRRKIGREKACLIRAFSLKIYS